MRSQARSAPGVRSLAELTSCNFNIYDPTEVQQPAYLWYFGMAWETHVVIQAVSVASQSSYAKSLVGRDSILLRFSQISRIQLALNTNAKVLTEATCNYLVPLTTLSDSRLPYACATPPSIIPMKMLGTDLTALGGELDLNARVERIAGTELNVSALTKKFADRMDADWEDRRLEDDPRLFNPVDPVPGVGVKMCRYKNWMGDPVDRGYITQRQHVNLMRFRLCVWGIEANRPRGRQRVARVCPMCAV
ncbi:hypothetical protein Agub_g14425, partial [Astrephomene gubernaculifera]